MATQLSQKRAFHSPAIPDRLYFKIGDVARICEVETYVLRFWETQFPQLKPNKSGTGQRLYRRRDVELALEIKRLVHSEGYTLSGARQVLSIAQTGRRRTDPPETPRQDPQRDPQPRLPLLASDSAPLEEAVVAAIGRARAELREIAAQLASPVPRAPRRRPRLASWSSPVDSLFPPGA